MHGFHLHALLKNGPGVQNCLRDLGTPAHMKLGESKRSRIQSKQLGHRCPHDFLAVCQDGTHEASHGRPVSGSKVSSHGDGGVKPNPPASVGDTAEDLQYVVIMPR